MREAHVATSPAALGARVGAGAFGHLHRLLLAIVAVALVAAIGPWCLGEAPGSGAGQAVTSTTVARSTDIAATVAGGVVNLARWTTAGSGMVDSFDAAAAIADVVGRPVIESGRARSGLSSVAVSAVDDGLGALPWGPGSLSAFRVVVSTMYLLCVSRT